MEYNIIGLFMKLKVLQLVAYFFTVETNLSAVHRGIRSAMLTIIVPGIGVAETNFFSLLTTCTMNEKNGS